MLPDEEAKKKGKSDIKGTCPECGMELIENPDYISKK